MFVNLVSLTVLIIILVFLARLTLRAWRIQKLWMRIPAMLLSAALTLVFAVISFFGIKGMTIAYAAGPPTPDLTVAGTPEQIARGKYIVNVSCVACHGADGSGDFPVSGGYNLATDFPMPVGDIVASNLTPGGVLAERTDGELFRAIRHGYNPSGRIMAMSFLPYGQLSDADLESIIAFLRSEQPVETASNGGDKLNLLGIIMMYGAGIIELAESVEGVVTMPSEGPTAEYGKYVATFGECRGCHSPDMTGTPASALNEEIPNPRPFVEAITLEQFVETMRTGTRPDGSALEMPWENASKMTDDDLDALYVYLTTDP